VSLANMRRIIIDRVCNPTALPRRFVS